MKKDAIVFTANTLHVAQANLMISSLFDENKGNFKGDLWVISTNLSRRCQQYLDSKGVKYLINPLVEMQSWPYREAIAMSQPGFQDGSQNIDEAFLSYRNKRMSKLIVCDWVSKFGDQYDSMALCDNDLYFQRDVNELFAKTKADRDVIWYWHEENKILPGTYLWRKNFNYTRLHDASGLDFGEHEINIGFIISSPNVMRQVFTRVRKLFSTINLELFTDCFWHDQDLVRLIRAQSPEMFRLFGEGEVLHLCNGGDRIVEERFPQEFFHKKTEALPYVVHFAGGAWKPYPSIAASFTVDEGRFFFMEEHDESYDRVRRTTDYDPFAVPSHFFSRHNVESKQSARDRWMKLKETSTKKSMLFFSWLDTGSHRPLKSMLQEFLNSDAFDLAVIDGNVKYKNHDDLIAEDLPDLLARVTHTVKNTDFGRFFGYRRDDVPDEAVEGAIASLMKEYGCSERIARAVSNSAYIYLDKALAFYKPDIVVSWAAYALSPRILRYLCKKHGIPFLTMEFGVLPGTLTFDVAGHMGSNWVAQHPESFKALPVTAQDTAMATAYLERTRELRPSRNVKLEVPQNLREQLTRFKSNGKKIVVYVGSNCAASGHVPYTDAARTHHSPFYKDNDDVVRHLSEVFADDPNIQLIYKPHPIAITRGLDLADEYPNVTVLQEVNLEDCLEIADLVVVKVSQGSYEALLRDKPVLMVGRNQICGSGAVYELEAKKDLRKSVLSALRYGLTKKQRAAFENHVVRLLRYYLYGVTGAEFVRPQTQIPQDIALLLSGDAPSYLAVEQEALAAYRKPSPSASRGARPMFSVIMPIYNGEEYLSECIGSVLSQDFEDIELICVNNGSTDGSQKIIDYFAAQDPRVRSLYQEEPNQSAARNFGAEHAQGHYIHFFDCDDILRSGAYRLVSEVVKDKDLDALYFFFVPLEPRADIRYPRFIEFLKYLPEERVFQLRDRYRKFFAQYPFPWAKIIRREYFLENKLFFPSDCENYEDNPQNLHTLLSSDNIYVLNERLYELRSRPNSISQSIDPRAFGMIDAVQSMNAIYNEFGVYGEYQRHYVPYKVHLVHYGWTRVPEDMRRQYFEKIPTLFLAGDEAFFLKDDLISMFSYVTEEKVEFIRQALRGEWPLPADEADREEEGDSGTDADFGESLEMEEPEVLEVGPEEEPQPELEAVALTEIQPEPQPEQQPEEPQPPFEAYPSAYEERVIKSISRSLSKHPKLFKLGKKVYRSIRPLDQGR